MENFQLAEQHFNQFQPLLRELYPEDRKDFSEVQQLMKKMQDVSFYENMVVGLFDHRTYSIIYLNDDSEKITKYNPQALYKWGGLILFKILHVSNFNYAWRSLRLSKELAKELSRQEWHSTRFFCSGIKMYRGDGELRRVFFKMKKVLFGEGVESTEVSVFWGEDITHLLKGDSYWFRFETDSKTVCFINQKGKKDFTDILSDREKEILRLVALHKTNQEIADELFLSKSTVETHRKNMIKRVGAVDSTALVHLCKMANII